MTETTERRLEREARDHKLAYLGPAEGVNVAKVLVSWYLEEEVEHVDIPNSLAYRIEERAGHFIVRATGEEPEVIEQGSLYAAFDARVTEWMEAAIESGRLRADGWQIDDTYSF